MTFRQLFLLFTVIFCAALISCSNEEPSEERQDNNSFSATGSSDGYEYIDIGLSVPWAVCNYGAFKPSQSGDFTISVYWGKSTSIPSKISGSEWDRIRHLMGNNWRLPTKNEINELKEQCTWKRCKYDGVEGVKVTGPNGKSIFFPITGWHNFYEIPWSNIDGPYLQYSDDYYGNLESNGKFDLMIQYEDTQLRYAVDNDGKLFFKLDVSANCISPLRGVYSSSNPSGTSIGNSGGTTNHKYPCKSCNESGKCWNCNGNGIDPINNRNCTTCHGTGKCQICNGRGFIII